MFVSKCYLKFKKLMDQEMIIAASKATVGEKDVSLKQWLNSGIQKEGRARKS